MICILIFALFSIFSKSTTFSNAIKAMTDSANSFDAELLNKGVWLSSYAYCSLDTIEGIQFEGPLMDFNVDSTFHDSFTDCTGGKAYSNIFRRG